MLDDVKLETAVKDLLLDICEVMSRRGYDMVNIGAMMRLVGVNNERASQHDHEFFALDDSFWAMLEARDKDKKQQNKKNKKVGHGATTIH